MAPPSSGDDDGGGGGEPSGSGGGVDLDVGFSGGGGGGDDGGGGGGGDQSQPPGGGPETVEDPAPPPEPSEPPQEGSQPPGGGPETVEDPAPPPEPSDPPQQGSQPPGGGQETIEDPAPPPEPSDPPQQGSQPPGGGQETIEDPAPPPDPDPGTDRPQPPGAGPETIEEREPPPPPPGSQEQGVEEAPEDEVFIRNREAGQTRRTGRQARELEEEILRRNPELDEEDVAIRMTSGGLEPELTASGQTALAASSLGVSEEDLRVGPEGQIRPASEEGENLFELSAVESEVQSEFPGARSVSIESAGEGAYVAEVETASGETVTRRYAFGEEGQQAFDDGAGRDTGAGRPDPGDDVVDVGPGEDVSTIDEGGGQGTQPQEETTTIGAAGPMGVTVPSESAPATGEPSATTEAVLGALGGIEPAETGEINPGLAAMDPREFARPRPTEERFELPSGPPTVSDDPATVTEDLGRFLSRLDDPVTGPAGPREVPEGAPGAGVATDQGTREDLDDFLATPGDVTDRLEAPTDLEAGEPPARRESERAVVEGDAETVGAAGPLGVTVPSDSPAATGEQSPTEAAFRDAVGALGPYDVQEPTDAAGEPETLPEGAPGAGVGVAPGGRETTVDEIVSSVERTLEAGRPPGRRSSEVEVPEGAPGVGVATDQSTQEDLDNFLGSFGDAVDQVEVPENLEAGEPPDRLESEVVLPEEAPGAGVPGDRRRDTTEQTEAYAELVREVGEEATVVAGEAADRLEVPTDLEAGEPPGPQPTDRELFPDGEPPADQVIIEEEVGEWVDNVVVTEEEALGNRADPDQFGDWDPVVAGIAVEETAEEASQGFRETTSDISAGATDAIGLREGSRADVFTETAIETFPEIFNVGGLTKEAIEIGELADYVADDPGQRGPEVLEAGEQRVDQLTDYYSENRAEAAGIGAAVLVQLPVSLATLRGVGAVSSTAGRTLDVMWNTPERVARRVASRDAPDPFMEVRALRGDLGAESVPGVSRRTAAFGGGEGPGMVSELQVLGRTVSTTEVESEAEATGLDEGLQDALDNFERGTRIRSAEARAEERVRARQEELPPDEPRTVSRREGYTASRREGRTVSRGPDTSRSGPTRTQMEAFLGTSRSATRPEVEAEPEPELGFMEDLSVGQAAIMSEASAALVQEERARSERAAEPAVVQPEATVGTDEEIQQVMTMESEATTAAAGSLVGGAGMETFGTDIRTEVDTTPDTDVALGVASEAGTLPVASQETDTILGSETEQEQEPELGQELEQEVEAEPETDPETEPELEREQETEPEPEPEPEPEVEIEPEPETWFPERRPDRPEERERRGEAIPFGLAITNPVATAEDLFGVTVEQDDGGRDQGTDDSFIEIVSEPEGDDGPAIEVLGEEGGDALRGYADAVSGGEADAATGQAAQVLVGGQAGGRDRSSRSGEPSPMEAMQALFGGGQSAQPAQQRPQGRQPPQRSARAAMGAFTGAVMGQQPSGAADRSRGRSGDAGGMEAYLERLAAAAGQQGQQAPRGGQQRGGDALRGYAAMVNDQGGSSDPLGGYADLGGASGEQLDLMDAFDLDGWF